MALIWRYYSGIASEKSIYFVVRCGFTATCVGYEKSYTYRRIPPCFFAASATSEPAIRELGVWQGANRPLTKSPKHPPHVR